ncbi:MbeB family mobilization protein [Enterobacter hormaechei]|nr:MbeB family mobilization protein [Enterobacter hormaechei]
MSSLLTLAKDLEQQSKARQQSTGEMGSVPAEGEMTP